MIASAGVNQRFGTSREYRPVSRTFNDRDYATLAALAVSDLLTPANRDALAHRLMINWSRLRSEKSPYRVLEQALAISELLERLGSSLDRQRRTADVHRWLEEYQVTDPRPFAAGGGFTISPKLQYSDPLSTIAAISLMAEYGIPAAVDTDQLRSYLRPTFLYDFQTYRYIPKLVARERLNSLADLAPFGVADYLRSELPLWLAMLLVLLATFATFTSPDHRLQRDGN